MFPAPRIRRGLSMRRPFQYTFTAADRRMYQQWLVGVSRILRLYRADGSGGDPDPLTRRPRE